MLLAVVVIVIAMLDAIPAMAQHGSGQKVVLFTGASSGIGRMTANQAIK